MLGEVEIGSIVYSLDFPESSRVEVFYIHCSCCVMAQFFMVFKSEVIWIDSYDGGSVMHAVFFSFMVSFHSFFWIVWYEELDFHLFKFTGSIQELSWGDFVSECFSYLSESKWDSGSGTIQNRSKVCE